MNPCASSEEEGTATHAFDIITIFARSDVPQCRKTDSTALCHFIPPTPIQVYRVHILSMSSLPVSGASQDILVVARRRLSRDPDCLLPDPPIACTASRLVRDPCVARINLTRIFARPWSVSSFLKRRYSLMALASEGVPRSPSK